jgi:hypothetical protein
MHIKQLHRAEPFLRWRQSLSYSRISQHFTEPQVSLQCSQDPSTGASPGSDLSSQHNSVLFLEDSFQYYSHITPMFSNWSLLFRFSYKHFVRISLLPIGVTYPANVILPDMNILVTFYVECQLWSSALCVSLQHPITSSLLNPNILPSTLHSSLHLLFML